MKSSRDWKKVVLSIKRKLCRNVYLAPQICVYIVFKTSANCLIRKLLNAHLVTSMHYQLYHSLITMDRSSSSAVPSFFFLSHVWNNCCKLRMCAYLWLSKCTIVRIKPQKMMPPVFSVSCRPSAFSQRRRRLHFSIGIHSTPPTRETRN